MKIALIGYGKMGRTIHGILLERGHKVSTIVDKDNLEDIHEISKENTDVSIEFTNPRSALGNISLCLKNKVPVISGTTGWHQELPAVQAIVKKTGGCFFHSSNFSLGVNIFFKLNRFLAGIMDSYQEYSPTIHEAHHTEKIDAPSGTAITLANDLIEELSLPDQWINQKSNDKTKIGITSARRPNVAGTHIVSYHSKIDTLELKHKANTREGFATGAVLVAEWIPNRTGTLTMDDFIKI